MTFRTRQAVTLAACRAFGVTVRELVEDRRYARFRYATIEVMRRSGWTYPQACKELGLKKQWGRQVIVPELVRAIETELEKGTQ